MMDMMDGMMGAGDGRDRIHCAKATTILAGYASSVSGCHRCGDASCAYSNLMPVISIGKLRLGLSSILQWIVIPAAGFVLACRGTAVERRAE